MTDEFSRTTIRQFAVEIAALTAEMATVAQAALTLMQDGYDDRAMDSLHAIEPLLFDTKTLLLSSSLLRRFARKQRAAGA